MPELNRIRVLIEVFGDALNDDLCVRRADVTVNGEDHERAFGVALGHAVRMIHSCDEEFAGAIAAAVEAQRPFTADATLDDESETRLHAFCDAADAIAKDWFGPRDDPAVGDQP
jgi:hypothetical protein